MSKMEIRFAKVEDAETLLAIYAPYVEHTAITFEYEIPSIEEFQQRILSVQQKYPYLVAEMDEQIVGYAYASSFKSRAAYDWAVETSIYVKEDMRGCGVGKALYQVLESLLKQMGITNVNACISYPEVEDEYLNRDSVKFHEHLGYQMVGMFHKCGYKFHRWYHMVWMEKMIGEHVSHQAPVRSIKEIEVEL